VLTPPTVLLDLSFLQAVADPAHPHHDPATQQYTELVDRYQRNERRLRVRDDHLALVVGSDERARRTLFGPCETIHVAGQHHRGANRLRLPVEVPHDAAVTLVVLRREHIDEIATFQPEMRAFDLLVLPELPAAETDS
jgi:hypothetical protein